MLPIFLDQSCHIVILVPCWNPKDFHPRVAVEPNLACFYCAVHQGPNVSARQAISVGMFCSKVVAELVAEKYSTAKRALHLIHRDHCVTIWWVGHHCFAIVAALFATGIVGKKDFSLRNLNFTEYFSGFLCSFVQLFGNLHKFAQNTNLPFFLQISEFTFFSLSVFCQNKRQELGS